MVTLTFYQQLMHCNFQLAILTLQGPCYNSFIICCLLYYNTFIGKESKIQTSIKQQNKLVKLQEELAGKNVTEKILYKELEGSVFVKGFADSTHTAGSCEEIGVSS